MTQKRKPVWARELELRKDLIHHQKLKKTLVIKSKCVICRIINKQKYTNMPNPKVYLTCTLAQYLHSQNERLSYSPPHLQVLAVKHKLKGLWIVGVRPSK